MEQETQYQLWNRVTKHIVETMACLLKTHPLPEEKSLYEDGSIFYQNEKHGTMADWADRERTSLFTLCYDNEDPYITACVTNKGDLLMRVYTDAGDLRFVTPNYLSAEDAQRFVNALGVFFDDQQLFHVFVDRVEEEEKEEEEVRC